MIIINHSHTIISNFYSTLFHYIGCNTGDVEISSGYNLGCRYILHAVPPLHTTRYHTAAQSSLFTCYRLIYS